MPTGRSSLCPSFPDGSMGYTVFFLFCSGSLTILFLVVVRFADTLTVQSLLFTISKSAEISQPRLEIVPMFLSVVDVEEPVLVPPAELGAYTLKIRSLFLLSKYSTERFSRLNRRPSTAAPHDSPVSQCRSLAGF